MTFPNEAGALMFAVELRVAGLEARVLGRGATLLLATAIYDAALAAYPDEQIVLVHGVDVMRDSRVAF